MAATVSVASTTRTGPGGLVRMRGRMLERADSGRVAVPVPVGMNGSPPFDGDPLIEIQTVHTPVAAASPA